MRGSCEPGTSGPSRVDASRIPRSPADSELFRQHSVALHVLLAQVFEEPAPLADQHEQAAAGVVVLLVRLEVVGQAVDALGQKRDLHFGGAGVALVSLELLDEALLPVDGQLHARILPGAPPPIATPPEPWLRLQRDGFVYMAKTIKDGVSLPRCPRGVKTLRALLERRSVGRARWRCRT